MSSDEISELQARVTELERRVQVLFSNTGALDTKELEDSAPEASPEVAALVADGDIKKAVKLYQEQTGGGMAEAMGAIGKLKGGG